MALIINFIAAVDLAEMTKIDVAFQFHGPGRITVADYKV